MFIGSNGWGTLIINIGLDRGICWWDILVGLEEIFVLLMFVCIVIDVNWIREMDNWFDLEIGWEIYLEELVLDWFKLIEKEVQM